jgi:predicted SnoaL-like aldol condensation-catalyzing enzyme
MNVQCKILKCVIAGLLTTLSIGMCQASESPHSALEQSNLKKALYCMDILENRPDLEPSHKIEILRNECFAENYIQHSPHLADGRDAVLSLFERRFKNRPEITTSVKRTASEGDLVWIHQHVKRTPKDLGRAVINIFRMKDGKFAEHWNLGQAVPEKSKNNNTMF